MLLLLSMNFKTGPGHCGQICLFPVTVSIVVILAGLNKHHVNALLKDLSVFVYFQHGCHCSWFEQTSFECIL